MICEKHHYYDGEKYESCPICGAKSVDPPEPPKPPIDDGGDNGLTRLIDYKGRNNRIIRAIHEFLVKGNWKFSYLEEDSVFRFGLSIGGQFEAAGFFGSGMGR